MCVCVFALPNIEGIIEGEDDSQQCFFFLQEPPTMINAHKKKLSKASKLAKALHTAFILNRRVSGSESRRRGNIVRYRSEFV